MVLNSWRYERRIVGGDETSPLNKFPGRTGLPVPVPTKFRVIIAAHCGFQRHWPNQLLLGELDTGNALAFLAVDRRGAEFNWLIPALTMPSANLKVLRYCGLYCSKSFRLEKTAYYPMHGSVKVFVWLKLPTNWVD